MVSHSGHSQVLALLQRAALGRKREPNDLPLSGSPPCTRPNKKPTFPSHTVARCRSQYRPSSRPPPVSSQYATACDSWPRSAMARIALLSRRSEVRVLPGALPGRAVLTGWSRHSHSAAREFRGAAVARPSSPGRWLTIR